MSNLEILRSTGVAAVPYTDELRKKVENAAEAWGRFVALPTEVKERLLGDTSVDSIGYEKKDGIGPNADRKENFDITAIKLEDLPRIRDLFDNDVAYNFVVHATEIARETKQLAMDFARVASTEFNSLADLEARVAAGDVFLRFLNYFGERETGSLIAEPHTDNSGFTFHLFETDKGCQRLDTSTHEWVDMPVLNGEMVVFPAMQLQLVSNGEIKALCHRVIAIDSTKELGRQAVVCFVRLGNTPVYNKTLYGRLQERKPGFNYDMNSRKFADLFVEA